MTASRLMFALLCAPLVALVAPGAIAAYPTKPITMVVAFPPGGGTDVVARALAPFIEKNLGGGARIVVVNRTGAGGEIGFAALAAAAPDGYTIGFVNTPVLLTIPIERKAQFHDWRAFDLLGNVVDDPGNFSVHADTPVKNLAELAALARAHPGKLTYGTTGIGSDDHLAMLMFERIAGVKLNHVPFRGAAEVRSAIAARQIDVASINIGEALQAQKGGLALRNLGQMSPARTTLAPDLPTFREQGYMIELSSLRGMAAPRGLPADIRERLVKAVAAAIADPEFQSQAVRLFAPIRFLPPAQFEAAMREADTGFRELWKIMPWADK